jgi:cytochrome oxidase Cu insertion factor (SCO1/SenC/PrrC family)
MTRPLAALLLGLACLLAGASCRPWSGQAAEEDDLGPVGSFSLTERGGRTVTRADLLGKVWVASFVFTRCTRGCPQVSATLSRLQQELARQPITFVTFTVDPEHDDPDELKKYAAVYQADPDRWLFLTGPEDEIYRLLRQSFHVHVARRQGKERTPGNEVDHSTKLVLVDRRGRIRGYFDGTDPQAVGRLRDAAVRLAREAP